jgi:hypothetical protein
MKNFNLYLSPILLKKFKKLIQSPTFKVLITYISRIVSIFHGTEIEILAGFGAVGSTEKNLAN